MSIIEKAAKRLAEKRRDGKESPETPTGGPGDMPPDERQAATQTDVAEGRQVSAESSRPGKDIPEADAPAANVIGEDDNTAVPVSERVPEPLLESGQGDDEIKPEQERWGFDSIIPEDDNMIRVTELGRGMLLSPEGGKTRTAEEFRLIKRPLLMKAFGGSKSADRHSNLIMVSSAVQGEGKTFISLNLAISIATEMDSTVLLIDADVAKPGLSKVLEISDRPGLIEILTDQHQDLSELLMRTDIPKLTVLPAGARHKRSTELLASIKMRHLVDEMASRYPDRIVLFDSPPLLLSTEASVLSSKMGQVVLVVESQGTSQMLVKEALSQIDSDDNVSLVLNKCTDNLFTNLLTGKYSGYGYGYGYGGYGEPEK